MFNNAEETEIPIHESTDLKIQKIAKAIDIYYKSEEFQKGNHLILPILTKRKDKPEIVEGVPEPELDSVVVIYSLKAKQEENSPTMGQWLETMVQAFDYISNIMVNLVRGVEILKREIKSTKEDKKLWQEKTSEWKN